MTQPSVPRYSTPPRAEETPTRKLDRLAHALAAPYTGGLSPVSLALALADWGWHLGVSPGRQMELAAWAAQLSKESCGVDGAPGYPVGEADEDPRFRHEAWATWPFNQLRAGFRNAELFWKEAVRVPGMTAHHTDMVHFFAQQWLGMVAPANWLPTNPVVLQDVVDSQGAHLAKGFQNWLYDVGGLQSPEELAQAQRFEVGRTVAVTPGKVVYRSRLIELIRFDPQTDKVHPEPVLIIPSWIMKYYILDLSPHNSMVRYLVEQGHTVYMLSWRNPDTSDQGLSMDDYLHMGVFDALRAVGRTTDATHGVHTVGYCLGGTLLSIGAAALGREDGLAGTEDLPAIKTITLLAAQTDFSEPGELGLFIDESQVGFLDNITRGKGYLTGDQMAGSFQFLHSRDLVWTRRMREYLMGEREQKTDLMAWNSDTTRMPARMHHEYLTSLYLHNALANSAYRVEGQAVSLGDIRVPLFVVGTQRDHISPWLSVYKLHHLCDAEITFVLTSGGHNAGIVSEPGHANRSFKIDTRPAHGPWMEHDQWAEQATDYPGSWWPAWHRWLARHSGRKVLAQPIPADSVVCDAPGTYVMQRYVD